MRVSKYGIIIVLYQNIVMSMLGSIAVLNKTLRFQGMQSRIGLAENSIVGRYLVKKTLPRPRRESCTLRLLNAAPSCSILARIHSQRRQSTF
jgi:hypothetical protein